MVPISSKAAVPSRAIIENRMPRTAKILARLLCNSPATPGNQAPGLRTNAAAENAQPNDHGLRRFLVHAPWGRGFDDTGHDNQDEDTEASHEAEDERGNSQAGMFQFHVRALVVGNASAGSCLESYTTLRSRATVGSRSDCGEESAGRPW